MDRSILDTLQRILAERSRAPTALRDDLLACLDRAPADDPDATELGFLLEKLDLPAALDEVQRTLAQIRAREPHR
jgi:hypothetical protein